MEEDERYDKLILDTIKELKKDVDSLKLWRSFILGSVAMLAFLLGAFTHELIPLFLKGHP